MLASLLSLSLLTVAFQSPPSVIFESDAVGRDARFGSTIEIDGDFAVIGAPDDGPPGVASGSLRIYHRTGTGWMLEKTIGNPSTGYVGGSADIDGLRVAVPRLSPSSCASSAPPGEVKIFDRIGGAWVETATIPCPGADVRSFGVDVALDGDLVAVVGTFRGTISSQPYDRATQVFVFRKNGTSWIEEARLRPAPDAVSGDTPYSAQLRASVDLDGDRLVLGIENSTVGGVTGVGIVSVFERQANGVWTETNQLVSPTSEAFQRFGTSLGLEGETLVVGVPGDDVLGLDRAGTVQVFVESGGSWIHTQTIAQATPLTQARFGQAIAFDGSSLVAAVSPFSFVVSAQEAVRVDTYGRDPAGSFVHMGSMAEPHRHFVRTFGGGVAVDGDVVIIGAPATLSHGQPSGAAYLYDGIGSASSISSVTCPGTNCQCPPSEMLFWAGCANSSRAFGQLTAGGSASLAADSLELIASGIPGLAIVRMLAAPASVPATPFGGGSLCIENALTLSIQTAGFLGGVTEPRGIASTIESAAGSPGSVQPGETWTFQAAYRDPRKHRYCPGGAGPVPFVSHARFNVTNAVTVTFSH